MRVAIGVECGCEDEHKGDDDDDDGHDLVLMCDEDLVVMSYDENDICTTLHTSISLPR